MAANKVILNGDTLIDLTQDTVIEENVAEGKVFHKANGEQAVGTATFEVVDSVSALEELTITENGTYTIKEMKDKFPIKLKDKLAMQENSYMRGDKLDWRRLVCPGSTLVDGYPDNCVDVVYENYGGSNNLITVFKWTNNEYEWGFSYVTPDTYPGYSLEEGWYMNPDGCDGPVDDPEFLGSKVTNLDNTEVVVDVELSAQLFDVPEDYEEYFFSLFTTVNEAVESVTVNVSGGGSVSTARTEFLERMAKGVPPAEITAEMLEGVESIYITTTQATYARMCSPDGMSEPYVGNGTTVRVVLPDTVTEITSRSFSYFYSLEEVVLSKNIKTIGIGAFNESPHLHAISLNDGLINICDGAFCRTGIYDLVIPESVIYIGNSALGATNLSVLYLPKYALIQAFVNNSIAGCENQNLKIYTDATESFCSDNGINIIPPMVLNSELCVTQDGKFQYIKTPDNKALVMKYVADKVSGTIDVPSVIDDCEVTYLSDNMFVGCDFEEGWVVNMDRDLYWNHHSLPAHLLGLSWANAKGTLNENNGSVTTLQTPFPSSFVTEDGKWLCMRDHGAPEMMWLSHYVVLYNGVSLSETIDVPTSEQFSGIGQGEEGCTYVLHTGDHFTTYFNDLLGPAFRTCDLEDGFVIRLPNEWGYDRQTVIDYGYFGLSDCTVSGKIEFANGDLDIVFPLYGVTDDRLWAWTLDPEMSYDGQYTATITEFRGTTLTSEGITVPSTVGNGYTVVNVANNIFAHCSREATWEIYFPFDTPDNPGEGLVRLFKDYGLQYDGTKGTIRFADGQWSSQG